MEADRVETEGLYQQRETGERILEDMDEIKEQPENCLARDSQLVEGLRCDLVVWPTPDRSREDFALTLYFAIEQYSDVEIEFLFE